MTQTDMSMAPLSCEQVEAILTRAGLISVLAGWSLYRIHALPGAVIEVESTATDVHRYRANLEAAADALQAAGLEVHWAFVGDETMRLLVMRPAVITSVIYSGLP